MGNCQAVDAAALVIQHPSGKIERMYWSVSASEVMKLNPGHYVSLIIPLPIEENGSDGKTVRFTRVKLLRPTDTLVLGRAYRLVTTQEVMKVLRAKKYAKMKKNQPETLEKISSDVKKQITDSLAEGISEMEKKSQVLRQDIQRQRSGSTNIATSTNLAAATRPKSWRPSLQSISEVAS